MTKNQIDYARLKEDIRHNQETELNARNVLDETNRHNIAVEKIQGDANIINKNHFEAMDAENARHNVAVEQETNRHNLAQESIQQAQNALAEQANAMRARELAEASRHNRAVENVNRYSAREDALYKQSLAETNAINAAANERNALTNFLSLGNDTSMTGSNLLVNDARIEDYKSQAARRESQSYLEGVQSGSNIINQAVSSLGRLVTVFNSAGQHPQYLARLNK